MISSRAIQISFALNASLVIALLIISGNSDLLQRAADSLFGRFISSSEFRLYLFEGLILIASFVSSLLAIRGIEGHAAREYAVTHE